MLSQLPVAVAVTAPFALTTSSVWLRFDVLDGLVVVRNERDQYHRTAPIHLIAILIGAVDGKHRLPFMYPTEGWARSVWAARPGLPNEHRIIININLEKANTCEFIMKKARRAGLPEPRCVVTDNPGKRARSPGSGRVLVPSLRQVRNVRHG